MRLGVIGTGTIATAVLRGIAADAQTFVSGLSVFMQREAVITMRTLAMPGH